MVRGHVCLVQEVSSVAIYVDSSTVRSSVEPFAEMVLDTSFCTAPNGVVQEHGQTSMYNSQPQAISATNKKPLLCPHVCHDVGGMSGNDAGTLTWPRLQLLAVMSYVL